MSGKRAKLERKKLREAGCDDGITRRRKEDRALYDHAVAAKKARARYIAGMVSAIAMLGCAVPSVASVQRQPRFQRRGR
jgi:hypothetical protein